MKAVIHATSMDGSNVVHAFKNMPVTNPIIQRYIKAMSHWKTPMEKLPGIENQGISDQIVGCESSKTLATAIPAHGSGNSKERRTPS